MLKDSWRLFYKKIAERKTHKVFLFSDLIKFFRNNMDDNLRLLLSNLDSFDMEKQLYN